MDRSVFWDRPHGGLPDIEASRYCNRQMNTDILGLQFEWNDNTVMDWCPQMI